jgi:aminoglycoside 2'-N-acetyltransferase I
VACRILPTAALTPTAVHSIRRLLDAAFPGDFSDDDWRHALGGWHAITGPDDAVTAHASVVARTLTIDGVEWRAGYVEAVAAHPSLQRTGLGTAVMTAIDAPLQQHFDLGALSTGAHPFYERLGWERWGGPSLVRQRDGTLLRTADDDAGLMVRRFGRSTGLRLGGAIICDDRPGDAW